MPIRQPAAGSGRSPPGPLLEPLQAGLGPAPPPRRAPQEGGGGRGERPRPHLPAALWDLGIGVFQVDLGR